MVKFFSFSFGVGATDGVISTLASLDYEERSVYHLILVVTDGTMGTSTPHRVTTSIVIQVLDVNDNNPILTPEAHTSFLTEGIPYPSFLFVHVSIDATLFFRLRVDVHS